MGTGQNFEWLEDQNLKVGIYKGPKNTRKRQETENQNKPN